MDYLKLACEKLGVSADTVLSHRLTEDSIILVIDKGIEGAPKHEIKFLDLEAEDAAEVEAKKVDALKEKLVKPKRTTRRRTRKAKSE